MPTTVSLDFTLPTAPAHHRFRYVFVAVSPTGDIEREVHFAASYGSVESAAWNALLQTGALAVSNKWRVAVRERKATK